MDDREDWFFRDKTLPRGGGHDWAAHEHAVFTLVVRGRLDEGLDREVQRCGAFELHYKPARLPHTTASGPDGVRMLLVGIRDDLLAQLGTGDGPPRVLPGGARAARALHDLLSASEHASAVPADPPRHVLRRLWEQVAERGDREPGKRPAWLAEVHERIRSERTRRRSLTGLAGETGWTPGAFAATVASLAGDGGSGDRAP